ncbi:tail fiber domain-containing protein [Aureispira sp. CCB-E]|uniref:tail fiber domain-containing protein n=1 Tax=Aureispira sp. CCB-E TaxID=3051121 RepID=UPI0028695B02|nr:tail fiber domain-containing protein [Aureispira sp. CCB-E]WMX16189.1 tail fiber domain-containing protein [Aureispira sp. CCB-E]
MNNFYKLLAIPALVASASLGLNAQNVGIGTNTPHTSAKLHITDANRGVLIPQISIGNINSPAPVTTPATGLLVWNTNATTIGGGGEGFYYWAGTQWTRLSTSAGTDNQNLTSATLTGTNLTINIEDGASTSVDLSALVNDADFVIGNEYNTGASLSGTNLNITDGGGTRTVNLASLVNDADFVVGNEYNTGASLSGTNLNITDGGGTRTVNLASLVNDADFVVGNEYNTGASLSGTNLNITDGGGTRTVNLASLNESGRNGLRNVGNFIHLGGTLIENTTVSANTFAMNFNLNNTGDFNIQDNGVNKFTVLDNGTSRFGGDVEWRDGNTGGTLLANLFDDGNDGRFIIRENGATSVDLDANSQFIFNEQGLDRNLRIESDGDANNFFSDAGTNRVGIGTGTPAQKLHVVGVTRVSTLAGTGNRMVIANANGDLATQAIPANGDITAVNAGAGIVGGGTTGTVTLTAAADNGLYVNAGADRIRLGGTLVENTTITNPNSQFVFNLSNTGDFHIQDNGINHFSAFDDGNTAFGGDVYWRDENTGGTILAQLIDDGNDGRFIIRENGVTSVDLDANSQFIFNEQGLDRNFRIESDGNANMFFVDAGMNRVSVGTATSAGTFNVLGNSYHSDDIYLRDGAVNGGDILVRIFDSADDGIIDVYENNAMNHRIHGNGTSVFNEQGNNNADVRMESDTRTNMFWLDADENLVRFGTASTFSDNGNGTTVGGTTVDYVADFDRGIGATGTAIGIGSVEYLLDNSSETTINNAFSPTTHINRDLGFSTTVRGWDDVYADNFVNISDLREKEDIKELSYGLEEVLKMRPVSYVLKQDPFGDRKLGLIAQEALVLVPEAVKTHDNKILDEAKPEEYTRIELERMGMTYQQLIPVLIKATQEQQAQIEALKAEIEALK